MNTHRAASVLVALALTVGAGWGAVTATLEQVNTTDPSLIMLRIAQTRSIQLQNKLLERKLSNESNYSNLLSVENREQEKIIVFLSGLDSSRNNISDAAKFCLKMSILSSYPEWFKAHIPQLTGSQGKQKQQLAQEEFIRINAFIDGISIDSAKSKYFIAGE